MLDGTALIDAPGGRGGEERGGGVRRLVSVLYKEVGFVRHRQTFLDIRFSKK